VSKEVRESVRVLSECAELQLKKSEDYQNPNSTVTQAMYYPNGVVTILDTLHSKYLRAKSLTEAAQAGHSPNFESLEDTFKDIINYASFAAAYCRGKVPGQNPNNDMFNRPKKDAE
jgi:hypothetical protein